MTHPGEQERNRLSTQQEQPPAGDLRRVHGRAELVHRGRQLEPEGLCLEHRAGVLDPRREVVRRPRADRAPLERNDPAVASVRVVQHRRAVEPGNPVRQHERRRRRPVVARDLPHERRLAERRRGNGVAEERGGAQVSLPHGHEPQAGHVRDPAAPSDHEHLAALRLAPTRQPTGAKVHPAAELVDGAEPEQRPAELALAVERRTGRPLVRDPAQLGAHVRVEPGVRGRLAAHAEPVHPHRLDRVRQGGHLAPDVAILRCHRAGENGTEHGRRSTEPEHDERESLAPAGEPRTREPEREEEPA